ncbi:MAG: hypothetical protein ACLPLZ_12360 [Terracidiphilus sp.]
MAKKTARVRVSRELADEAMRALGVRSRSEAARIAVMIILGRDQRKELMGRAAEGTKTAQGRVKSR